MLTAVFFNGWVMGWQKHKPIYYVIALINLILAIVFWFYLSKIENVDADTEEGEEVENQTKILSYISIAVNVILGFVTFFMFFNQ